MVRSHVCVCFLSNATRYVSPGSRGSVCVTPPRWTRVIEQKMSSSANSGNTTRIALAAGATVAAAVGVWLLTRRTDPEIASGDAPKPASGVADTHPTNPEQSASSQSAASQDEVLPVASSSALLTAAPPAGGTASPKDKQRGERKQRRVLEEQPQPAVPDAAMQAQLAQQVQVLEQQQRAEAMRASQKPPPPQKDGAVQPTKQQQQQQQQQQAAAAEAYADDPGAGQAMIDAIVQRAVLTQPADLLAAATRPVGGGGGSASAKGSGKKSAKKEKKGDKGGGGGWHEAFQAAVSALESAEASHHAQQLLDAALVAAQKPSAPRDAAALTLRGIGFSFASTASLDEAAAAYARALAEAKRRAPESASLLGCWRDMAILRRERGEHAEAETCWCEAAGVMGAMHTAVGKATKGGPTYAA